MKIRNFIIAFSIVIFHSCEKKTEKTAIGLYELTENWKQKKSTFWIEIKKDSSFSEIKLADTLKHPDYKICETFEFNPNKELNIKKLILINSSTKNKISETDIYSKKINANIKSELNLTYDYQTKKYSIILFDSLKKKKKRRSNRVKLDSMYKYAEKNNLYLCGTAANEILYEDIPEFPSIIEMKLDSALIIIEKWKNEEKPAYNNGYNSLWFCAKPKINVYLLG